ncbi:hypothetical protein [uncultured Gammaproteobacteria bacterium]|nr:hypothetical protein [uncultured Gammaproteobacteria bacterium]
MLELDARGFLSHLCGGESLLSLWLFYLKFLSHLCGGESLRERQSS